MAAPACAVLSGWLVLNTSKSGKWKRVELVKWISNMRAMSIILFCNVAKNSFLCFVRPFAFQLRMRREWDVSLLFNIVSVDNTWENSGEERDKRVYDRFKFIKEF